MCLPFVAIVSLLCRLGAAVVSRSERNKRNTTNGTDLFVALIFFVFISNFQKIVQNLTILYNILSQPFGAGKQIPKRYTTLVFCVFAPFF